MRMEYTDKELREAMIAFQKSEYEKCKEDFCYFIDEYGHIEDKDNTEDIIQPFKMWPAQREAAKSVKTHRLNIALKARQLGFSWLAAHDIVHEILFHEGHTAICLSKTEEEAKELVRRVALILRYCLFFCTEKGSEEENPEGITFKATALSVEIYFPKSNKVSKLTGLASSLVPDVHSQ